MTRKSIFAFVIFPSVALFLMNSCTDEETFPITPAITFKTLEIIPNIASNDSLVLTFSFTDGDGDIGAFPYDTLSRDVYVTLFEKRNGVFVQYEDTAGAFNYRIPFLIPRGNNKSLKGDIRINIEYNPLQPNDTVYYELYMTDRAQHQSNSIVTSTIITRVE